MKSLKRKGQEAYALVNPGGGVQGGSGRDSPPWRKK